MSLNPRISSFIEEGDFLKFTLSDCNVSIANAIRRIILSEIPTFVFRTFPHNENKAEITANTSRLNNEIIKQRLGCIPIHIDDLNFPYKNYIIEVDVKNDTDTIRYVTTKDFKIKNILTEQYSSESSVRKIFPPSKISGDYIEFARLLPKLSENIDGERLSLKCLLDIGTAKQDGMYNVASTCTYSYTIDKEKAKSVWKGIQTKMIKEGVKEEDIEFEEKNWYLLEGKRHFIENSFDFIIESVGVISNIELLIRACNIMINKLNIFISGIMISDMESEVEKLNEPKPGSVIIRPSETTLENSFDITLVNEDYTIGKVIEYYLYDTHYFGDKTLSFCGFRKNHPHDKNSVIRLGYHKDVEPSVVVGYLEEAGQNAITAYKEILSQLTSEESGENLGGLENQISGLQVETKKPSTKVLSKSK
jgi:DNA-directed RNA polymerase subunit L